jgi:hypothetical protein
VANTDDENISELVDEEKLEDEQYPPDRPLGAEDRGINNREDSVVERMRRENPDRWASRWEDEVGTIVDPTGESGVDDEGDAVASEARGERDRFGFDRSTQDLEEIEPAEEAAMHLTDPPPMGDGDGYVED